MERKNEFTIKVHSSNKEKRHRILPTIGVWCIMDCAEAINAFIEALLWDCCGWKDVNDNFVGWCSSFMVDADCDCDYYKRNSTSSLQLPFTKKWISTNRDRVVH